MPEASFPYSDVERELLEQIRIQEGLSTLDQAAEWLVKTRLRRQTLKLTGRNRAIYPVGQRK